MTPATMASRPRTRQMLWLAAPVLGLLLYWRVPLIWFQNDDFAWLALGRDAREHGILHAVFTPFAQGTVRVLGDRIYFLALSAAFGLHALPFHLVQLAVWASAVALVALVGGELTGSPVAGAIAALVWAAGANAVSSVAWLSAFDQTLCAACLLAAFYARLRGRRVAEWVFYIAAFGALEITVMYPVLALLYVLATNRKQVRPALWLFLPAALFTALHFFLIPKAADGPYALSLDSRLPSTISTYFAWTFEPASSALRSHAEQLKAPELLLGMILALTLAWFVVRGLLKKEWIAGFCVAWFGVFLVPVLLLPDHLTPYYLTLPSIGIAWIAGWAIVQAWSQRGLARFTALALAAAYLLLSAAGIDAQTRWFQQRSNRMREVAEAVGAEAAAHPGVAIALRGVDDEVYRAGFQDHPFSLVGAEHVWRVPQDISDTALNAAVASGQARVLEIR